MNIGMFRTSRLQKNSIFILLCLILFALAIFKIKPHANLWRYPLAAHSYNHHHTIISVLDDLQRDTNFLKGDLVVEAIKEYFVPYKYIQIFFVNILGADLTLFVNLFTILSIAINFLGIASIVYILTSKRTAVIISLVLLVACRDYLLLYDALENFPRFMSQGICMVSLAFFLRKRFLISLILCSSSFIFHYGMPFYLGLIYFFYFLCRIRDFSVFRIIFYFFIFIMLSSFISQELIKKVFVTTSNSGYDAALWKKIIYDTGFFWSFKRPSAFFATVLFPFSFFYITTKDLKYKKEFIYLFIGYMLTLVIHLVVFDLCFFPTLVRPTIFNVHYYLSPFILIIYSVFLFKIFSKNTFCYLDIAKLYFISFIYILFTFVHSSKILILAPSIILFMEIIKTLKMPHYLMKNSYKWGRLLISLLIFGVISTSTVFYAREVIRNSKAWKNNYNWLDIQQWILNNTDKQDKLIIPFTNPSLHGMRIYGKRSVLSLKPGEIHFVVLLNPDLTKKAVEEFTLTWDVPKKMTCH